MKKKCPETWPEIEDGKGGTVMVNHQENARIYQDCKDRHNSTVDLLNKYGM